MYTRSSLPPAPSSTHQAASGVWLLPAVGALLLWATFDHQPDPASEFHAWAQFVTTGRFRAQHLVGSIIGQALDIIAVAALTAVLVRRRTRMRHAVAGFVTSVLGGAALLAGFGVAAFAQPALGRLELNGSPQARALYDDIFSAPLLITLVGGTALFSVSTLLSARAMRTTTDIPAWAVITYAASGPLIGLLGVVAGALQTAGSLALIIGGAGIARHVSTPTVPTTEVPVATTPHQEDQARRHHPDLADRHQPPAMTNPIAES